MCEVATYLLTVSKRANAKALYAGYNEDLEDIADSADQLLAPHRGTCNGDCVSGLKEGQGIMNYFDEEHRLYQQKYYRLHKEPNE